MKNYLKKIARELSYEGLSKSEIASVLYLAKKQFASNGGNASAFLSGDHSSLVRDGNSRFIAECF